jgi:hypothetical protein
MQAQPHEVHEFIGPVMPVVAPSVPQRSGRSNTRSLTRLHVGLSLWVIGFAAGFVFWQYVGFWGVIQSLFYPGSPDRSDLARSPSEPSPVIVVQSSGTPQSVGLLSVRLSADNCSSLVLGRGDGRIVNAPCDNEVMPLNSLIAARKQDRRISVAEAKAATASATAVPVAPPHGTPGAKPKSAPAAPAVASWSATVLTSPPR